MLLTSLILSIAVNPGSAQQESRPHQDPALDFPPPKADMLIPVDEQGQSWSMLKLITEYGRMTDQHFVLSADIQPLLGAAATGLTRSVQVPKSEVQSVFEGLLHQNDFMLNVVRAGSPRLLSVESLTSGRRNTVRAKAAFVPEDLIETYGNHPAMLITTVVHLPNSDVRQLSNSLRTMITDANTQQMVPAGTTNNMVVTGFGGQVADMVRMLRIADKAARIAGESASADTMDPVFERFPLAHAVAAEVAPAIEDLVNSGSRRMMGVNSNANPQSVYTQRGHTDARVVYDARTNALVVMAMPYDMKRVEKLVGLFDKPQ